MVNGAPGWGVATKNHYVVVIFDIVEADAPGWLANLTCSPVSSVSQTTTSSLNCGPTVLQQASEGPPVMHTKGLNLSGWGAHPGGGVMSERDPRWTICATTLVSFLLSADSL